MKKVLIISALAGISILAGNQLVAQRSKQDDSGNKPRLPDVIILSKGTKIGPVTFNHVKHNSGEYSADGMIQCIQCHHTAQPAADLVRIPPHRTVWPPDRKTTLTAELFAKDPKMAGVAACRDCHARQGQKPKLLASMPAVTDMGTHTTRLINNKVAFHSACDACHFDIRFRSNSTKAPAATNCSSCHKNTNQRPPLLKRSNEFVFN